MTHQIKVTSESHVDHGLTPEQLKHVLAEPIEGFTIRTVELPPELGTVPCGLFGPLMGDEPVSDADVVMHVRGDRKGPSRCVRREPRAVRQVTVIAGPHGDEPAVLYTAFGGPVAEREPFDVEGDDEALVKSRAFWAEHALAL